MTQLLAEWEQREQKGFETGLYTPVPIDLPYPISHYLHLSVTATETDYIAYTPSEAYGIADRRVRMRFGRYLKKTFPYFDDAQIQGYVSEFRSALAIKSSAPELHFTTETAKINEIFETRMYACGSTTTSCMYGKFDGDSIRPYHVYANSPDVAIAYMTTSAHGITARSVVSVKDKVWVRAYSHRDGDNDTDCSTLKQLLKDAGYTKGDLYGNRLSKLPTDDVMLPYIDNSGADVDDADEYWLVVSSGEYTADCTDGTATCNRCRCSRCDNDEDNCECTYCECCCEYYYESCPTCNMCDHCDRCVTHDRCTCTRCTHCEERTDDCECDICSECGELEENCNCERCDRCNLMIDDCACDPETESEPSPDPAPDTRTVKAFLESVWNFLKTHKRRAALRSEHDRIHSITDAMSILLRVAPTVPVEVRNMPLEQPELPAEETV